MASTLDICWILLTSVLCSCSGRFSKDFITLRYYGRETSRFQRTQAWPDDPAEVCQTFPAICVNLHFGQCLKSPPEFQIPWTRNVTDRDAGRYIHDPPLESGLGGYILLTGHEMKYESNKQVHAPRQIFSQCEEGCYDCARGTGLALHPLMLPMMQVVTEEGGAWAAWYNDGNGTRNTEFNCEPSLADYWRELDDKNAKTSLIKGLVGAAVAVLLGLCAFGVYCKHRRYKVQFEAEVLASIREGRAEFIVGTSTTGSTSQRQAISQPQIEEQFPITSIADSPMCTVCLSPVEASERGRKLQCNHCFHADCILSWWLHRPRKQIECPVCRHAQTVSSDPPEVAAAIAESAELATAIAESEALATAATASTNDAQAAAQASPRVPSPEVLAPTVAATAPTALDDSIRTGDAVESATCPDRSGSGPALARLAPSPQPQVIGSDYDSQDLERGPCDEVDDPTRC